MLTITKFPKVIVLLIVFIYSELSTSFVLKSLESTDNNSTLENSNNPGLYYGFNKSVLLNCSNFKNTIFQDKNDKFWLVEFYLNWCGYCIRFSPMFKAFATDVYGWRDTIGLGTLDCGNDMNNQLCRNLEIKTYPTMKIFPPNSNEDFEGIPFGKGSETNITEMREKLANMLKSYHNSHENVKHSVNLKLLKTSDLDSLWKTIPPHVLYLMLVFESKDSVIGAEVTLDISRTPEIQVRLVDPRNKNLSQILGMEDSKNGAVIIERDSKSAISSPTSETILSIIESTSIVSLINNVVIERESKLSVTKATSIQASVYLKKTILKMDEFTREGLNKAVRGFLINHGVNIEPELPEIHIITPNATIDDIKKVIEMEKKLKRKLHVKSLATVVFQLDLEGAINYCMKNEIPLKKDISGESLTALRNLLTVVIKYFPSSKNGTRLFKELKEREVDGKDKVSGETFQRTFLELEKKYQPFMPNQRWVGCQGTIPQFRGYPCSLWTMFHTLTVQEELIDRNSSDEKPEVLNAMVGYIKNYFSCSECAEHFTEMAKTIDGNVTTQRDAVLWLWRAHNQVNKRLSGDETEDPRHHKTQFPSPSQACSFCHHIDGSWNESQVFDFMSKMYTNIVHLNPDDLDPATTTAATISL